MPDQEHLVAGLHSRGVLPHLKREGGTYFVTFRLAGTLPKEVLLRFKQERAAIIQQAKGAKRPLTWQEQEELFRWYSSRVDKHLDAGHGTCHLRDPALAGIVAWALQFFEGQRYELRAWVVMPNHVHVVVWPKPPQTLSAILHSWKSYSAHEINHRLPAPVVPFWQGESYDHLIRDEDDLHRCCHYTLMNPVNAGLCARDGRLEMEQRTGSAAVRCSAAVPGGGFGHRLGAGSWNWRRDAAATRRRGRLRYNLPMTVPQPFQYQGGKLKILRNDYGSVSR
jgi:REP element-mobilizing transposase RayT